jgi:hypothetical protein
MLSQVYHHGVQQRHTAEFCNSGYELPKNREIRSLAGKADDGALRNQQHVRRHRAGACDWVHRGATLRRADWLTAFKVSAIDQYFPAPVSRAGY